MAIIGNWQNWLRIMLIVLIGSAAFKYTHEFITKGKTSNE